MLTGCPALRTSSWTFAFQVILPIACYCILSNLSVLGSVPPFQAPINAQMLAQRQREILNQHLRQRQMHQQQQVQQRTLMMRGQGLTMTPSMAAPTGLPAAMSNPRIPQANAQQFPFPPSYGTGRRPLPSVSIQPVCPFSFLPTESR